MVNVIEPDDVPSPNGSVHVIVPDPLLATEIAVSQLIARLVRNENDTFACCT